MTCEKASEGHGNKAKATIAGNTSYTAIRGITGTELVSGGRFTPGDIVQVSVRVKRSNLVPLAAGTATSGAPTLFLRHLKGSSINCTAESLYSAQVEWLTDTSAMPTSGEMVLTTWRSTIGATTDRLDVIMGCRGAAFVDLEFERLAAYKGA